MIDFAEDKVDVWQLVVEIGAIGVEQKRLSVRHRDKVTHALTISVGYFERQYRKSANPILVKMRHLLALRVLLADGLWGVDLKSVGQCIRNGK